MVGHDCGHRSFSSNKLLEDIVGTLMFMPLIFPFEPWRIKHNQHHAFTNKLVDDTAWHPVMESEIAKWSPTQKTLYQVGGTACCCCVQRAMAHVDVLMPDLSAGWHRLLWPSQQHPRAVLATTVNGQSSPQSQQQPAHHPAVTHHLQLARLSPTPFSPGPPLPP